MAGGDRAGPYGIGPWGTGIQDPAPRSKVYDFGITTSGWSKITMEGTAGEQVDIRYSEKLNADGTVDSEGDNAQTDTYIFKGSGPETYEPKYGWKGYRYIQVWAPSGPAPTILSVKGVVVHTALPTDGSFNSSSSLLNTMHDAMKNTILNNQYSYGSDTPVYEKGGWTNDNGDYATSEMDNFDAEAYYDHMMQNFDDSQDGSGNIGFLVPTPPGDDQVDPLWGGSFLLIEYDMYQQYDNLAVIRRDYSHMADYVDDLAAQIAPSGDIYQGTTFGDWVTPPNDPNPPSSEMLGTMFLYRETKDLSIMAAAIGNTADASKYASLAADIRTAINDKFYNSTTHAYDDPAGLNSARDRGAERHDHRGNRRQLRPDGQRVRPGVRGCPRRGPAGDRQRPCRQRSGGWEPPGHRRQRLEVHTADADQIRLRQPGLPRGHEPDRSRLGPVVPAVRRDHHVGGMGGLLVQHGSLPRPRIHGHGG